MVEQMEAMEGRVLMSAVLEGRELTIIGTEGADEIVVRLEKGRRTVRVSINGERFDFHAPAVKSVTVSARGGADLVDLRSIGKASTVWAGSGNDEVHGGRARDRLMGEAGNDRLYGRDGNDELMGGFGKNKLFGGAGKDSEPREEANRKFNWLRSVELTGAVHWVPDETTPPWTWASPYTGAGVIWTTPGPIPGMSTANTAAGTLELNGGGATTSSGTLTVTSGSVVAGGTVLGGVGVIALRPSLGGTLVMGTISGGTLLGGPVGTFGGTIRASRELVLTQLGLASDAEVPADATIVLGETRFALAAEEGGAFFELTPVPVETA